jgi:hypothetical protein
MNTPAPVKAPVEAPVETISQETAQMPREGHLNKAKRPERIPLSQRNVMKVKHQDDPNYHYRQVRDRHGRVQEMEELGYEKVLKGTVATEGDDNLDSYVTFPTKDSDECTVLMRIKKEWYEENQDYKAKQIKEVEDSMKPDGSSVYGDVKINKS